jgi:hypothetical protein
MPKFTQPEKKNCWEMKPGSLVLAKKLESGKDSWMANLKSHLY